MLLEVCAFNIQSCIIAQQVGAARVELCDSPVEGGTTPSYGVIRLAREKVRIDLYPIIRPRAGNYWYSDDEFAIMKQDILLCRQLGCDGISVGVHKSSAHIDTDRMKRIVEWAYPMAVTCNRVFDATPDPFEALEQLIECGCERILTSGQKTGAPEGAELLAKLVEQAGEKIIIMPGAGIRSSNIGMLIQQTHATEFHTSARKIVPDTTTFQNPAVSDIGQQVVAGEEELRLILEAMRQFS